MYNHSYHHIYHLNDNYYYNRIKIRKCFQSLFPNMHISNRGYFKILTTSSSATNIPINKKYQSLFLITTELVPVTDIFKPKLTSLNATNVPLKQVYHFYDFDFGQKEVCSPAFLVIYRKKVKKKNFKLGIILNPLMVFFSLGYVQYNQA